MTDAPCINCGHRAVQLHHVVYEQELMRRYAQGRHRDGPTRSSLRKDQRNLVPVCKRCHERHHSRFSPLFLLQLPDSVFEFATEVMGPGAAYEYLSRRYRGTDPRLSALLEESAA
jgi:hypothetical protein